MKNHKLEVGGGSYFDEVAKEAKKIARKKEVTVEFEFNGVKCLVSSGTDLSWLYRDYHNASTMNWKTVGPNCVEKYSAAVQADFERRSKIREEEHAKQQAEYRAREEKEKKEFEIRVRGVELELSDPKAWKKGRKINSDGYSKAAMDYAEGWAKLMQIEIAKGKTINQCYDYTQKGIDFLGITGFQFGCAVSVLAQTWKHGEELRKVHNKRYGVIEDKGGTVNPAILTFK